MHTTVTERVAALRRYMAGAATPQAAAPFAYFIPTADPHNDEYIPPRWMCREWLTGFTGSAGTAVVTPTAAALWTDSRYWLQAEAELAGTPFVLMRDGQPGTPSPEAWIAAQAAAAGCAATVACPVDMLTLQQCDAFAAAGVQVLRHVPDAFNAIWPARPALPAAPITCHAAQWAGEGAAAKLARAAEALRPHLQGCDYVFTDLSDVAWLLNLRGGDIAYNPLFTAYLTLAAESGQFTLFTHLATLTPAALAALQQAGVALKPYAEAAAWCSARRMAADPSCTLHLCGSEVQRVASPVPAMRAVKHAAEQEGFRQAMVRDGVAMVRFLRQLDERMAAHEPADEIWVDEVLTALRAQQEGYAQLSFPTIAGYAAHGAVVHYEATPATAVPLEPRGLLLIDSGAHYDSGTTDITRTVALGPLTAEERRVYTLVLKGHLALARQHFPQGTTGLALDLAARSAMWNEGYDFGHGTGHGVGACMCVHEGPHQIRKDLRACTLQPFAPGMLVTDEPGIYVAGRFGVRIENVLLCVADRTTDFGTFLRFDTLTLCPYDLRAVERDLLSADDVRHINAYHQRVRLTLTPHLSDPADRAWLAQATAPLA